MSRQRIIRVRAVRKNEPDIRRIALALIEMAEAQAAIENFRRDDAEGTDEANSSGLPDSAE